MIITIDAKVEGKYPSVQSGKTKYNVTPEMLQRIQIGKTYEVITKDRTITSKKDGKEYTFKDIVAVMEPDNTQSEITGWPTAAPTPLPVDRDKAIKENMEIKSQNIAISGSLRDACVLTEAYVQACIATEAFKGLNEKEIKNWIRSMKDAEFKDNMKKHGITIEEDLDF